MKKKVVKRKKQNSFSKEIIGVFIVGVSILLGIALFTKEAGIIGKWIRYGFVGFFGMFAYLTVMIGVVLGIMILQGKKEETRQLLIKLAPIYIIGMPFLHLVAFGQNHTIPLFQFIELASWQNGGLIGALLGYGLLKLIGIYASYVLLLLLAGIWILYITQFPLGCWLQNTLQVWKEKQKDHSKKKSKVKKIRKKIDKKQLIVGGEEVAVTTEGPIDKSLNHDILIYDSSYYEENTDEPLVVAKEEKISEKKEAKVSKQKLDTAEKQAVTKEVETLIHKATVLTEYHFPSLELLNKGKVIVDKDASKRSLNNAKKLETTLESFGVEARVLQIHKGPTVTRYELQPKQGVKVSKIVNLADDIALNLAASAIRIEAPIPGKSAVGIEVANEKSEIVYLRDVIDTDRFLAFPSQLAFALGKDITGKPIITDIAKMPHILIAGATGSGKSVCINTLITSLIYKASPDEVKLIMIDPKVVELNVYNGIPHLLIPVVTDPKKAAGALWWAVNEMTRRYQLFAATNVRDRKGYNKKVGETEKLPSIVIIIDELADLMMTAAKEVEDAICRLAQMARAAGIHLVIATQRPSVDVITGVIKANIPSRLAFSVSSGIDSRTILDMNGAEKLLGKGDMLFYPIGESKPIRIQGAFISDKEVESIVNAIKVEQIDYEEEILQTIEQPIAQMKTDEEEDELISQAVELAQGKEKLSISMLQRYFRIGFNRASRLMDALESKGIVGPDEGSKPRRVLK